MYQDFILHLNDLISHTKEFLNETFHELVLIATIYLSFATHFKSSPSTTSRELRHLKDITLVFYEII